MVFTPSLFDPPTDPPADPVRVQRYLAVCVEYGEEPGRLVRRVTAGRTIDPAALTSAEMDALLDVWLRDHNAILAPTGSAHSSPLRHLDPGITGPDRDLKTMPNHRGGCDGLRITAPQSNPGISASPHPDPECLRDSGIPSGPRPIGVRRTKAGITPPRQVPGAAGPERERYVVAMGQELLVALRVHAARRGQQMGAIVADAVTGLLDDAAAGDPIPALEPRWNVPSADRSRLAMSWPAGLADRLRDAVARSGRPAHELVAVAVTPVVAPRRGAGR
jgi:hypothetical protein